MPTCEPKRGHVCGWLRQPCARTRRSRLGGEGQVCRGRLAAQFSLSLHIGQKD